MFLYTMDILYIPEFYMFVFSAIVAIESRAEPQPVLEKSEIHINITAGRSAILPCMVTGITDAIKNRYQIVWQNPLRRTISYGTQRITSDRRFTVQRPYDADWNLHIQTVEPSDHGEYRCQLNTQPVQQKKVFLHVHVPPDITASPDTEVPEGDTLILYCNVTGQPQPSVTWYKDGITLLRNSEILEIQSISRNQAGTYRCRATNTIEPAAVVEIKVDVLYQPEVETLTMKLSQFRGKEAILECRVRANPHKNYSWNKNGKRLPDKPWKYKTEVFNENGGTQIMQLRIMSLEKTDFGRYHCKAKNNHGTDSDQAELIELQTVAPTTSTVTSPSTSTSSMSSSSLSVPQSSSTQSSKKTTNGNPTTNQLVTNKYSETTNKNSETAEKYGSSVSGEDNHVIKVDQQKNPGGTGTSTFPSNVFIYAVTFLIFVLSKSLLDT